MPCSAEGGALLSHADELEVLPAAEQYRVDQGEVAGFPEPRDFALIELPEFLLIEAVEPGQRERSSVIQANIEQDRREKLQRDQCGNELLGRCPARHKLVQDGQYTFQVCRNRANGIDEGLLAR